MRLGRRTSQAPGAMRWPLIFALTGAVLLLLLVSTGRETYRSWKINDEIDQLQSQVDSLEGKKLKVLDTIQQLGSSEVVDREARLRLGMRRPGERVMIVKGLENGEYRWNDSLEADEAVPTSLNSKTIAMSNPQKWFHYFFSFER